MLLIARTLSRFSGIFAAVLCIVLLISTGFFPIPGYEPPLAFLLEKEFTVWLGVGFAALSGASYFIAKRTILAAAMAAISIMFFGLAIIGENFLLLIYGLIIFASVAFLRKFFTFQR